MTDEQLKAYEQTDVWINQVGEAYIAFNERTENGLLAIDYLIHDLERIKAGEIVFTTQTEFFELEGIKFKGTYYDAESAWDLDAESELPLFEWCLLNIDKYD